MLDEIPCENICRRPKREREKERRNCWKNWRTGKVPAAASRRYYAKSSQVRKIKVTNAGGHPLCSKEKKRKTGIKKNRRFIIRIQNHIRSNNSSI